jgi:uncharacterized membrane-anchored protein YjiN (DUF445 family)
MQLIAGGLLLLMVATFVLAVRQGGAHPVWPYVKAFSEAALVGGLADWFAVTALFRHPLGLPIPHTAIIPRNKERLAIALGDFVTENFLAPEVISRRLEKEDLTRSLARTLAEPATAKRISDGIIDALPGIVGLFQDDTVSDFLRKQLGDFGKQGRFPTAIGRVIDVLTRDGRHHGVIDALLVEAWKALENHQEAIHAQVSQRTGWFWRLIGLDTRASKAMIESIEETLQAMAKDRNHPARQRITDILQTFAADLQTSPQLRADLENVLSDLLKTPAVAAYFSDLWKTLRQDAELMAANPDAPARAQMQGALVQIGKALADDETVRASLNRRLRAFLCEIAGRHRHDAGLLIRETIRGWDTQTVVAKLEQNVGPDLQYIRINGTLIGGLIGLVIYQVSLWLSMAG